MKCYHPIKGWLSRSKTANGKRTVVFNPRDGYLDMPVTIPCGQCIGCRLRKSQEWAIRCLHESTQHEENCFLTLTYDDEHLPADRSLDLDHFQRFLKRLRKHLHSVRIRYFHCGEYGDKLGRPHYHAIIFGWYPVDAEPISVNHDGTYLYTSETLSKLWPYGFNTVGDVTFESAAYVARYVTKKVTGKKASETDENGLTHYQREVVDEMTGEVLGVVDLKPEYTTMSRRPGIGKTWLEKYGKDVLNNDEVIINGRAVKPPKYYDGQFEITDKLQYYRNKAERKRLMLANAREDEFERNNAGEIIKEQTMKQSLKRKLEKS